MSLDQVLIRQQDLDHYRKQLGAFQNNELDFHNFTVERLLMGVYSQRQDGLCMVRSKIPGGVLPTKQLPGFADALDEFSNDEVLHISTRQNIQFHNVPLEKTADMLESLSKHGVSSREAGGNTVRNVCACPLAGVCPHEQTDVQQHVQQTVMHFIHNPLTHSMPRKFKIGFSGCAADCAQNRLHDLSVIAVHQDGKPGFKVYLGGGLGAKPHVPIELESFIEEAELIPVLEAAVSLHNKHSDRSRKKRSRVKFLVDDFGAEGVREHYLAEKNRTVAAFDTDGVQPSEWFNVTPPADLNDDWLHAPQAQRQAGFVAIPVQVAGGDLNAATLRGLAKLFADLELAEIRTTLHQDFIVPNVPENKVGDLIEGLEALGLNLPKPGGKVTACPGTRTCQLGITASSTVRHLLSGGSADLRVNVNGCQNSCAHSELADIGLYGKGKRHFGKLVPTYALQLGGHAQQFGFKGPEIPTRRAPQTVERIHDAYVDNHQDGESFTDWSRRLGASYFDELLADLVNVEEHEVGDLVRDHGDDAVFQVTAVGTGECAGAQVHPVEQLWLDVDYENTLRDAFAAKHKYDEAGESLNNALQFGAKALLQSAGIENNDVESQAVLLAQLEADEQSLIDDFSLLQMALLGWRAAVDELAYPALLENSNAWLARARVISLRLQANRPAEEAKPKKAKAAAKKAA